MLLDTACDALELLRMDSLLGSASMQALASGVAGALADLVRSCAAYVAAHAREQCSCEQEGTHIKQELLETRNMLANRLYCTSASRGRSHASIQRACSGSTWHASARVL